jgi:hypothetical protein
MTRNTKIILGVLIAAVLVLCLCACMMAFAVGSWFINRTVTVSSDSVYVPVEGSVAVSPPGLHVEGSDIAAAILSSTWR